MQKTAAGSKLTKHAKSRIRERCGIPKKAVPKNAESALAYGVTHREAHGRLHKYFDFLHLTHRKGNNIRIYGNHVYIFRNETLITVLPLPNAHRNSVKKIVRRREGGTEMDEQQGRIGLPG